MLVNKIRNVIDFFDTRGLDSLFLACVTSLVLIGMIMVASSTVDFAAAKFSNPLFFFKSILFLYTWTNCLKYSCTHKSKILL